MTSDQHAGRFLGTPELAISGAVARLQKKGFDLLWKGLEVTTGAQREHRYDRLMQQAVERGYALGPLRSYLEFFRYGCPPRGGVGIGLGRRGDSGWRSVSRACFKSRNSTARSSSVS